MTRRVICVAIIACGVLAATGCQQRGCHVEHFDGTWSGPLAITGTATDSPNGLAASAALRMSVSDVACIGAHEEVEEPLTFDFGPTCVLEGVRTSDHTKTECSPCGRTSCCHDVFIDGTAAITANAPPTCELALYGVRVKILVEEGTAHVTADGAFDVTLSGSLVRWQDADEQNAYVTVHFASAVPSDS
jgi:hypothetical protein